MYLDENPLGSNLKSKTEEVLKKLKEKQLDRINELNWMDETTKRLAKQKLAKMEKEIGN